MKITSRQSTSSLYQRYYSNATLMSCSQINIREWLSWRVFVFFFGAAAQKKNWLRDFSFLEEEVGGKV